MHTELSELGCVSRFNGATLLCFLDLLLLFTEVQAWFYFKAPIFFWLLGGGGAMPVAFCALGHGKSNFVVGSSVYTSRFTCSPAQFASPQIKEPET